MIADVFEIFKARKNPALAAKLGARFASGAAIERLGWPLLIAKFWIAAAIIFCIVLAGLFITGAYHGGWGFAIPALIPVGVIYGLVRIWRGLNKGVDRVKTAAQNFTDARIDRMDLKNPTAELPAIEP